MNMFVMIIFQLTDNTMFFLFFCHLTNDKHVVAFFVVLQIMNMFSFSLCHLLLRNIFLHRFDFDVDTMLFHI